MRTSDSSGQEVVMSQTANRRSLGSRIPLRPFQFGAARPNFALIRFQTPGSYRRRRPQKRVLVIGQSRVATDVGMAGRLLRNVNFALPRGLVAQWRNLKTRSNLRITLTRGARVSSFWTRRARWKAPRSRS